MTKRVTIEIPEKMYFLLSKFGSLHDMDADDYATMHSVVIWETSTT